MKELKTSEEKQIANKYCLRSLDRHVPQVDGVRKVDLLLTGEMRHHDVLSRVAGGTSVILTDHTNTERGYLPILAKRVQEAVAIDPIVSQIDTDPLRVV